MGDADKIALIGGREVAGTTLFGIGGMNLEKFVFGGLLKIEQEETGETGKAFANDDDVFGTNGAIFRCALDGLDEEVAAFAIIVNVKGSAKPIAEAIGEENGVTGLGIVEGDDEKALAIFDVIKDGIEPRIGCIDGFHVSVGCV